MMGTTLFIDPGRCIGCHQIGQLATRTIPAAFADMSHHDACYAPVGGRIATRPFLLLTAFFGLTLAAS